MVWALFLTANTKDLEPITSIILKFFDQHDRVLYLVEKAITREIETTCAPPSHCALATRVASSPLSLIWVRWYQRWVVGSDAPLR